MRRFILPLVLALSSFSANINADALGLFIGGGLWKHDPSGSFSSVGDTTIDMESNLGFSSDNDTYFYAAFEHFVPLVPNVRVEIASMEHTGTASGITFNGVAALSGPSSVSIDTIDAIIYWRLLDNWVNLDVGLNARQLEGDFIVGGQTVPVSATVPMLYLAAQIELPFSGFSVGGDVNIISFGDVTYQDVRLRAMYEMGIIGFELGLKTTTLELDAVDSINADLEFSGMTVGAFLHF